MHDPALFGRVSLDGVREVRAPQVEKQQQEGREANPTEEGQQRVEGSQRAVHVAIDEACNHDHGELCDEEAHDDEAEHGPNRLPGR